MSKRVKNSAKMKGLKFNAQYLRERKAAKYNAKNKIVTNLTLSERIRDSRPDWCRHGYFDMGY